MQDWLLKGGDATVLGKLEGTMGGRRGGFNDHSSKSWIYQALVRMHYKGGFYFFVLQSRGPKKKTLVNQGAGHVSTRQNFRVNGIEARSFDRRLKFAYHELDHVI